MDLRFHSQLESGLNECPHENSGEELTDHSLGDSQRTCERMHGCNRAPNGGHRGKTEIGKPRGELIHIRRCRIKTECAVVTLLYELISRCPGHAKQKISAYAALNPAPRYGAPTKQYQQKDAHIQKQRNSRENASQFMQRRSGMQASRWRITRNSFGRMRYRPACRRVSVFNRRKKSSPISSTETA
jgi:hypothetical protein